MHCQGQPRLSKCHICGIEFAKYQEIVTRTGGGQRRKRYHIKCAEAKNIL